MPQQSYFQSLTLEKDPLCKTNGKKKAKTNGIANFAEFIRTAGTARLSDSRAQRDSASREFHPFPNASAAASRILRQPINKQVARKVALIAASASRGIAESSLLYFADVRRAIVQ